MLHRVIGGEGPRSIRQLDQIRGNTRFEAELGGHGGDRVVVGNVHRKGLVLPPRHDTNEDLEAGDVVAHVNVLVVHTVEKREDEDKLLFALLVFFVIGTTKVPPDDGHL